MKHPLFDKTKAIAESMRPKTIPLALMGVFIGGIVADSASYASFNLFLAVVAAFFVTAGSLIFNDYYDWKIDKVIHPNRPIPSGRLLPKEGLYFAILSFCITLILSFFINIICFGMAIISIVCIILYDELFKKKGILGNLVVAFVSAMSFTFGSAAVGQPFSSMILSIMAFFIFLGREILMDVRDIGGDMLARVTLPMQIGEKTATYIGCIFLAVTIILTPLPFLWGILSVWYLLTIIFVDLIGVYVILLSFKKIRNIGKMADLVRIVAAVGLISFIVGSVM